MSSPDEHIPGLIDEMELSAQTGDLIKLQSQLARWEAEVADGRITWKDHLWSTPTVAEILDWGAMKRHTDKREPVYKVLTRLLICAARANQVNAVEYILDKRGGSIIPMVAAQAMNANAFDVLEVFLNHGWNINDPYQKTFLPILGEMRTRWCLEHGADANARNKNGCKDVPSEAGRWASMPTLRLLASYGANFPCSNALHRAAEGMLKGRMECLQWLLDEAGFPINQREFEWDPEVFQNTAMDRSGTALHFAVLGNFPERVRFLLERGIDISIQDGGGKTARDWADGPGREEVAAILDGWGK